MRCMHVFFCQSQSKYNCTLKNLRAINFALAYKPADFSLQIPPKLKTLVHKCVKLDSMMICTMVRRKITTNSVVDLVKSMAMRRKPPSVPSFTQKIICTLAASRTHNISNRIQSMDKHNVAHCKVNMKIPPWVCSCARDFGLLFIRSE